MTNMVTVPLDKLEDMQRRLKELEIQNALYADDELQNKWQGLNEDEFIYFCHWVDAKTLSDIEAKLKEKNT